jgi:hypothetical protein
VFDRGMWELRSRSKCRFIERRRERHERFGLSAAPVVLHGQFVAPDNLTCQIDASGSSLPLFAASAAEAANYPPGPRGCPLAAHRFPSCKQKGTLQRLCIKVRILQRQELSLELTRVQLKLPLLPPALCAGS